MGFIRELKDEALERFMSGYGETRSMYRVVRAWAPGVRTPGLYTASDIENLLNCMNKNGYELDSVSECMGSAGVNMTFVFKKFRD